MKEKKNKGDLYSGIVWIVSACSLITYGLLGLFSGRIPGVEQVVFFVSNASGTYIYIAAFLSIFIEGLYFLGSFFPGTTLITIIALLSQVHGTMTLITTVSTIFLGWCVAGALNIFFAKTYRTQVLKQVHTDTYHIHDRLWTTWFPAFRANYEVAQVAAGGNPMKVFLSSVRVKFLVSLVMIAGALIAPFIIDIHNVSNKEGFLSLAGVASISFTVGVIKIRSYLQNRQQ